MKNLFSYDSKFFRLLSAVTDMFLLNLCFVVSSLPIFTLGAAQSALHTGVREVLSGQFTTPLRTYWKSFGREFGRITLVSFPVTLLAAFAIYTVALTKQDTGEARATLISVAAIALTVSFSAIVSLFHSNFSCTPGQLVRNSLILMVSCPIRCLLSGGLMWLPVLLVLVVPEFSLSYGIVALIGYWSVAAMFVYGMMKRTIDGIKERFSPEKTEDAEE